MKVLLLDLDGILTSTLKKYPDIQVGNTIFPKLDAGSVRALNRVIADSVEYVITSDKKRYSSKNDIRDLCKVSGIALPPLSFTANLGRYNPKETLEEKIQRRYNEINDWVERNEPKDWCIIDPLDFSSITDKSIQINPEIGLDMGNYNDIIRILNV